jgi:hypothetical protein
MEYLNEIKDIYKDIIINKYSKYKGIQTEEDLILVLKSTQLLKDKRREIIELWRQDPIRILELKYGKETIKRVLQKKKEDLCEEEIIEILNKLTKEEQLNIITQYESM